MIKLSACSNAKEVAGASSVSRSIHRVRMDPIGCGIPMNAHNSTGITSGTRCASVYAIDFFKLANNNLNNE